MGGDPNFTNGCELMRGSADAGSRHGAVMSHEFLRCLKSGKCVLNANTQEKYEKVIRILFTK
jgi:hypothetical protein